MNKEEPKKPKEQYWKEYNERRKAEEAERHARVWALTGDDIGYSSVWMKMIAPLLKRMPEWFLVVLLVLLLAGACGLFYYVVETSESSALAPRYVPKQQAGRDLKEES